MDKTLEREVDTAVVETVWRIIQEPLTYFSEADIQQLLVHQLSEIDEFKEPQPTALPRGKKSGKPSREKYKTPLIHREYGGGEGTRVDVVIFDKEDAATISDARLRSHGEYLDPLFAFELGTETSAASRKDTRAHLDNDLAKLNRCLKKNRDKGDIVGKGYIIHFFRSGTLSPPGGKRNLTDQKIEKNFKSVVSEFPKPPSRIKILPLVRHVLRGHHTCWLFAAGKWQPLPAGDEKAVEGKKKLLACLE
jgi:hypothetical protein